MLDPKYVVAALVLNMYQHLLSRSVADQPLCRLCQRRKYSDKRTCMKAKVLRNAGRKAILAGLKWRYRRGDADLLHRADRGAERAVRNGYRLVRLQHPSVAFCRHLLPGRMGNGRTVQ